MIDWSVFDKFSESTCACNCGAEFRSHAKSVFDPAARIVSRKPCPSCGRNDDLRRVASDTEVYAL